jgi:hypothetical protein
MGKGRSYGPTFAARGVATGVPRPTKMDTELSPELVVQMLPLGSTAMPAGALSPLNPAAGVTAAVPAKAEIDAVFANQERPLASKATAVGSVNPPPETGLAELTVPSVEASVNAPATAVPVVDPVIATEEPVTATLVAPKRDPSVEQPWRAAALVKMQRAPLPALATRTRPVESTASAVGTASAFEPVIGLALEAVPVGDNSVMELPD